MQDSPGRHIRSYGRRGLAGEYVASDEAQSARLLTESEHDKKIRARIYPQEDAGRIFLFIV